MYGRRHVHVNHREVIIARFGTWILSSRKLAGFRENALDGPNVVFPLVLGQVATAMRYVINGWLTDHWKGNVLFLPDTHSLLCTAERVSPSERVPSRTLYELARACFWISSMVRVCLLAKGHAEAPENRHSEAKAAFMTAVPAMIVQKLRPRL